MEISLNFITVKLMLSNAAWFITKKITRILIMALLVGLVD